MMSASRRIFLIVEKPMAVFCVGLYFIMVIING
jgi:hypothetical protein